MADDIALQDKSEHVGPIAWPDAIDEIFRGDLTVAVGMPTPKGGVALASVTPVGLTDRAAGTVSFTTSLGLGRKLERIAADPRIGILYHTRQHGHSSQPGIILVQGVATIRADIDERERDELKTQVVEHLGQIAEGWFWDRWLSTYYYDRVIVEITAKRILWWPGGDTGSAPTVLGASLPQDAAPPQPPTTNMTEPRVDMKRVSRGLKHPHRVIGVLGADGMPLVLPVEIEATDERGVELRVPSSLLPDGARRAGLLAHDFRPKLIGLSTATHTGWLQTAESRTHWTPHTRHAFTAPANKTLLLLLNGAAARWGYRQAIKQGRTQIIEHARLR